MNGRNQVLELPLICEKSFLTLTFHCLGKIDLQELQLMLALFHNQLPEKHKIINLKIHKSLDSLCNFNAIKTN